MSETVLYNFTGAAGGSNPQTLVQYGSTAYGIAQQGGANSAGTIFSISLNSPNTFNKLYDFSSNILLGVLPISIVINTTGTILYGVAAVGGTNNSGTIFSFSTSPPYTYTKIYDLSNNSTQLNTPNQLLLSGSTLYGYTTGSSTTQTGSLFKINISGTGYTELYSPASASPYDNKIVGLTISGSTLYFSTNYDSNYGSIYSIPVTGGAATTLLTCTAANAVPTNLTISGSTIYFSTHTATSPGPPVTYANWQICSISTTGTGFQQLTSLSTAQPDGVSSIVLSGNTLYAASFFGGTGSYGGLYSISTSVSPSPTLLYSFQGPPTDGYAPFVNIFYNSNLYGVTFIGGTSNLGTIFSYGPKQYNFLPRGSTISDRYNISTNGTCQIGDNSNNLLTGTLTSPPGKTNTYTLAVKGNINCVGATTDVSGASTGTYYSNSVTSFRIAADSSANRPPIPLKGYIRYNTDVNFLEFWNGTQWYYLSFLTSVPNTATGTGYSFLYTDLNNLNPTTSGPYENGYTVFKYLGPSGTFVPNFTGFVQLLLVGGGGGGGRTGGGGGGGAVVNTYAYVVATSSYSITVGQGGAGSTTADGSLGLIGTSSIFTTLSGNVNISAIGGGGGGSYGINGGNGGSGGGAGATDAGYTYGGTGLVNGLSGTNYNGGGGGNSGNVTTTGRIAGGGGGAGAAGTTGTTSVGGNGGNGIISNISGTSTYYAGGGGGIAQATQTGGGNQTPGTGGLGGGGNAVASGGAAGTANTGGGGGGFVGGVSGGTGQGGQGGSGIVFVQFPSYSVFTLTPNIPSVSGTIQMNLSFVNGANEPSIYPVAGGYTIATITSASSASITFSNSSSLNLYFLAVGGGGGGGSNLGGISSNQLNGDGGGGGGSVITNFNPPYYTGAALPVSSSLPITAITIGSGGNPGTSATAMGSSSGASWGPGGNTQFTCNAVIYLAYGGGGGGSFDGDQNNFSNGQRSGSAATSSAQGSGTGGGIGSGGGVKQGGGASSTGGTASPAAGSIYNTYAGSAGNSNTTGGGSGGGGASGTTTSTPTGAAGTAGANGIYSTIINSTGDYYGSGGGGGAQASQNATGGSGGTGGGGQGCGSSSANQGYTLLGLQGASNKGGGGGGGGGSNNTGGGLIGSSVGGSGGSGVIIFRFSSFGDP
jgi:hypothetical protein